MILFLHDARPSENDVFETVTHTHTHLPSFNETGRKTEIIAFLPAVTVSECKYQGKASEYYWIHTRCLASVSKLR